MDTIYAHDPRLGTNSAPLSGAERYGFSLVPGYTIPVLSLLLNIITFTPIVTVINISTMQNVSINPVFRQQLHFASKSHRFRSFRQ